MLELLCGQIPEAIYFALFMIYAKQLKEKKFIFIFIIIAEYLVLFHLFPYSLWAHVFFFAMTYLVLKVLYEEKSQITDVFTMGVASLILTISSVAIGYWVWILLHNYVLAAIVHKVILFIMLYVFRNKIHSLQTLYKNMWNRNDNIKKPLKSITFRAVNVVIFNVMFIVINIFLLLGLMLGGVSNGTME